MEREEQIAQELISRFNYLQDKVRVARQRRIFAEVSQEQFKEVFEYVQQRLGFTILCTITGLDEQETFGIIYHCAHDNGTMINIKTRIPKNNPVLATVTSYFPSADAYEREMIDLLGIKVQGLPEGLRYPLPDDWPADEHPLRKDWKPDRLSRHQTDRPVASG